MKISSRKTSWWWRGTVRVPWRPHHIHVPNSWNSGSLNLLENSGLHRARYGSPLLYYYHYVSYAIQIYYRIPIFKTLLIIVVDLFVIINTVYFFANRPQFYPVTKKSTKPKFPHFCNKTVHNKAMDIEIQFFLKLRE